MERDITHRFGLAFTAASGWGRSIGRTGFGIVLSRGVLLVFFRNRLRCGPSGVPVQVDVAGFDALLL